jgi:hypothetical protein
MTNRMYIFTRKDLKPGYQAVQACHSVVLMEPDYPGWDGYMILLSVRNRDMLEFYFEQLKKLDYSPKAFYEPDMHFQMTSFSVMVHESDWFRLKSLDSALKQSTTLRGWLKSKFTSRYN